MPEEDVYDVGRHESRISSPLPLCGGASPCRSFPRPHHPLLGTPPIKVRVLIVSLLPPAVTGGKSEKVEGKPVLRGTKNCHSPRPLAIFAPHRGYSAVLGGSQNCRTRLEPPLWLSRKAESGRHSGAVISHGSCEAERE